VTQHLKASPSWGLGDALVWFLVAQVSSILVGGLALAASGYEAGDTYPMWLVAVLQVPLWVGYLAGPIVTTRLKGRGPVEDLGARIEGRDILPGLAYGVAAQLVVIPLFYYLVVLRLFDGDLSGPARDHIDRADDPVGVVLIIAIAVIGAPLVEELFFRGLLLRGLERRFGTTPALLVSSVVFAGVHLQGLQFPALFLFGLLAGWLTVRSGRLGPAWAAHVGFNATTVAILLLS
jgi:membrane protease YdiL (CAAX protease family)